MLRQLFVANAINFDAAPTTHAEGWRPLKFLGRLLDEHILDADCRSHGKRDVSIVVTTVGKHGKHFLADKPGWFAMRDLFPRSRQRETDASHAFYLLRAVIARSCCLLHYLLL